MHAAFALGSNPIHVLKASAHSAGDGARLEEVSASVTSCARPDEPREEVVLVRVRPGTAAQTTAGADATTNHHADIHHHPSIATPSLLEGVATGGCRRGLGGLLRRVLPPLKSQSGDGSATARSAVANAESGYSNPRSASDCRGPRTVPTPAGGARRAATTSATLKPSAPRPTYLTIAENMPICRAFSNSSNKRSCLRPQISPRLGFGVYELSCKTPITTTTRCNGRARSSALPLSLLAQSPNGVRLLRVFAVPRAPRTKAGHRRPLKPENGATHEPYGTGDVGARAPRG